MATSGRAPRLGRYERLKRDTSNFVTWLVNVSNEAGYVPPLPNAAAQASPYDISTREIEDRVAFLAEAGGLLYMPCGVVHATKRAITLREQVNAEFEQEEGLCTEANEGHAAFVRILKSSIETLSPLITRQVARRQGGDTLEPMEPFLNLLSNLTVNDYEEEEEEDVQDESHPTTPQVGQAPEYHPMLNESQERRVEWFCRIADIKERLNYLSGVWDRVWGGKFEWIVAGLLTDFALQHTVMQFDALVKNSGLDDKIFRAILNEPIWKRSVSTLERVLLQRRRRKGYLISLPYLKRTKGTSDKDISADCYLIQIMMDLGLDLVSLEWLRSFPQAVFDLAKGLRKSKWRYFHPGGKKEVWLEPPQPVSLDSISRALVEVLDGVDVELPSIVASEILQIMQPSDPRKSGRCLDTFLNWQHEFSRTLNEAGRAEFATTNDANVKDHVSALRKASTILSAWIGMWPVRQQKYISLRLLPTEHALCGTHREVLHNLRRAGMTAGQQHQLQLDQIDTPDHVGSSDMRKTYESAYITPSKDGDFFRRGNLLACSKPLIHLRVLKEEIFLAFANSSAEIFCMCHVINALSELGYLKGVWKKIQQAWELHMKTIFRGERPMNAGAAFTRFLLSSGIPFKEIVASQKLDPNVVSEMKKFHDGLESRIQTNKPARDLLPSPISQIIRHYFNDTNGELELIDYLHRIDVELEKATTDKLTKSEIDDSGFLPFLQRIELVLPQVLSEMDFNYVHLTLDCAKIFHEIDQALFARKLIQIPEGLPRNVPDSRYFGRGYRLTWFLLEELNDAEMFLNRAGKKKAAKTVKTPKVDVAVKILENHMASLGLET
ncbi:hypothetical protein P154DRAFT_82173 [Amniculicola lignicola CBS 123094]|uniref:DUF6604 domain-containing protein n=1 Tax=Amniculicola lignicola CBS 123094 TaxID=1392246 RepID=A0A6A5VZF9_9PLEO|nr:hypothetical protein P154DRAFT_82173 [Amniculicola lignicola CBS 123094]